MITRVEPTWETAIGDSQSFWLNLTLSSPPYPKAQSLYLTVLPSLELDDASLNQVKKEGLSVRVEKSGRSLKTHVSSPNSSHENISPYHSVKPSPIASPTCMDISPGQVLIGGADGLLRLWTDVETNNPVLSRDFKGHIGDVNTAKLFPSKTVVLSGGADVALKIWTLAEDGIIVAQLKGHKRGVLSCDFVERGKNVVSASHDGTAILWDVSTQEIIYKFGENKDWGPINECHVGVSSTDGNANTLDARDAGTEGKLLYLASESGNMIGFDLRSRSQIISSKEKFALNAVTSLPNSDYIVSGGNEGVVVCWDKRNSESPLSRITLPGCTVNRLLPNNNNSCFIACSDGMIYDWNCTNNDLPTTSYVSDTEPIYGLGQKNEGSIVSLNRRGILRFYWSKKT